MNLRIFNVSLVFIGRVWYKYHPLYVRGYFMGCVFRHPGADCSCMQMYVARRQEMSKVCQVTGKRPMTGHNVSHSNIKTNRRFEPNLHYHRFWLETEKRFVRLRLTPKGMRIIDKLGIEAVVADIRARGEKV